MALISRKVLLPLQYNYLTSPIGQKNALKMIDLRKLNRIPADLAKKVFEAGGEVFDLKTGEQITTTSEFYAADQYGVHYSGFIETDFVSDTDSPRNWDNLGKIYTVSGRNTPDGDATFDDEEELLFAVANDLDIVLPEYLTERESGYYYGVSERYEHIDTVTRLLELIEKTGAVVLPVYAYVHSGIALSTSSCQFDGELGYIVATPEAMRESFGVKRVSGKMRKLAEGILDGEVDTYGKWLNGEVYGYTVLDLYGDAVDSCVGFYAQSAALSAAKEEIENPEKYFVIV